MKDPYQSGMFNENPYYEKTPVLGKLVVVLQGKLEGRGLALIKQPSRCVLKHEIHELILTDEPGAAPGAAVNNIAYLGFFEVSHGGVITVGDGAFLDGVLVGTVAGFDETHMPNHQNIVLKGARSTGVELGAELGSELLFRHVT